VIRPWLLAAAVLLTGTAVAGSKPALAPGDTTYTFGVGLFTPSFTPPAPGSYELPVIDSVADHALVDAEGHATTLGRIVGDRLAVVSFIYGTCSEAAGCPLSTAVLHRLDQQLAAQPELARDVALVTISFDPTRDTPTRLAEMQKQRAKGSTWQFVSTRDEAALAPLLADFGQSISKLNYPDGAWTGTYRHVLKVYLLDRGRQVRNVYSVGYLQPELVRNDLLTLTMKE